MPIVKKRIGLELFDMENDMREQYNVAEKHPETVERLLGYIEQMRNDLGDSATGRKGKNKRLPGRIDNRQNSERG